MKGSMKKIECLVFLMLALDFALGPASLVGDESDDRPNIIYIMADDLGYGDLGCYGQQVVQTPRIDQLAAEGMRFTSHYAGNTVCRPSRLSLWTGLDPRHTAIRGNQAHAFRGDETTVAKLLKHAGYRTGGIGKWALKNEVMGHPNDNGFDFWMGYLDQGEAHNFYPAHLWRNREKISLNNTVMTEVPEARGRVSSERNDYSHDILTDEALGFIRRNAEGPFLLHAHYTIPHANNEGGRVTGDGMEVPDYGQYASRDWPNTEKGFAAMMTRLDRDVGRIVDTLKELGIDHRTLILFTSDNGPHEEGGHKHEYFDSNGPLRGYKRDLYEGGIRVPLIAWWPGKVEAGATSDHISAFWDYLPTACELAGVAAPDSIDGISYAPTLRGGRQERHDVLHWEFDMNRTVKRAARIGKWKLVQPGTDKPWELYDLSKDIGEARNLAKSKRSRVQQLLVKAGYAP